MYVWACMYFLCLHCWCIVILAWQGIFICWDYVFICKYAICSAQPGQYETYTRTWMWMWMCMLLYCNHLHNSIWIGNQNIRGGSQSSEQSLYAPAMIWKLQQVFLFAEEAFPLASIFWKCDVGLPTWLRPPVWAYYQSTSSEKVASVPSFNLFLNLNNVFDQLPLRFLHACLCCETGMSWEQDYPEKRWKAVSFSAHTQEVGWRCCLSKLREGENR